MAITLDGSLGITTPTFTTNSIIVPGSTSGNVTVIANAISGNTTSTLPLDSGLIQSDIMFRIDSNIVTSNTTSTQNVFNVGVTLQANTVYQLEGLYAFTKTAGAASHTLNLGFGGSATVYNILYQTSTIDDSGGIPQVDISDMSAIINTASLTAIKSTFGTASQCVTTFFKGTVSINVGGTFTPQFSTSAAVGPYTLNTGSYIKLSAIGSAGANAATGTWA